MTIEKRDAIVAEMEKHFETLSIPTMNGMALSKENIKIIIELTILKAERETIDVIREEYFLKVKPNVK